MISVFLLSVAITNQPAITLEFEPPVGQTYRYRVVTSTTSVNPISLDGRVHKSSITETSEFVLSISKRENDLTTLQFKEELPTYSMRPKTRYSGQQEQFRQRIWNSPDKTMEVDRRYGPVGRLRLAGTSWEEFAGLAVPTLPIRLGESWTCSLDIAKLSGMEGNEASFHQGIHQLTFRFTKLRRSHGVQIAQIDYSIVTREKAGILYGELISVKGKGSMTIDTSTGLPISMRTVEDNTLRNGTGPATDHAVTAFQRE